MCSSYSQFFSDYLLKYFFVFLQLFYHSVYFIECLYPGPVDERAADPGAEPGGGGPHQVTAGSWGDRFLPAPSPLFGGKFLANLSVRELLIKADGLVRVPAD